MAEYSFSTSIQGQLGGRDSAFPLRREEIEAQMAPEKYVGRAPSQVEEFLAEEIAPLLEKYPDESLQAELNV